MNNTHDDIEAATHGALETALWTGTTDNEYPTPLDSLYGIEDFADESAADMRERIRHMVELAAEKGLDIEALEPWRFGHDFVLTAQHHGAGYWDRGYGALGDALTELAQTFSVETSVSDDGRVWIN